MRKREIFLIAILACLLVPTDSFAKFYIYRELKMKNYDEIRSEVNNRVMKAKELAVEMQKQEMPEQGDQLAVEQLRDALQLILSRPDTDNMLSKPEVFNRVRSELRNYNAFEDTLMLLTNDAIHGIGNEKIPKSSQRATYIIVLNNIMSQLKAEATDGNKDFQRIILKIRDADIEIPDKVKNEMRMNSMSLAESPSKIAERIAKKFKKEKQEEE